MIMSGGVLGRSLIKRRRLMSIERLDVISMLSILIHYSVEKLVNNNPTKAPI